MTNQIASTLIILAISVALFITERIRVDLVALMVLGALALSGLITPPEALSGFSSPAVVTVWAVFILSGGLARTGIANIAGRYLLKVSGKNENRLIFLIMISASILSAFMNNVGVVALFLPVVIDIARKMKIPPSKLLIPLSYACLMGGLTTQIGTPPNILASNILIDYGLDGFHFFSFTPIGVVILLVGTGFMLFIGKKLLPSRDIRNTSTKRSEMTEDFNLHERISILKIPPGSSLSGTPLEVSRIGKALKLNVIGIIRNEETHIIPDPKTILYSGDKLLVTGSKNQLRQIGQRKHLILEEDNLDFENLISTGIDFAEITFPVESEFIGKSLIEIDFRNRFGLNVIAIIRDGRPIRTHFQNLKLRAGYSLLVQGHEDQLEALKESTNLLVATPKKTEYYHLHERLMLIGIPEDSTLDGKSLEESQFADAYGMSVLGIIRDGITNLMPESREVIKSGDTLLVEGRMEDLSMVESLQELKVDREDKDAIERLESSDVGSLEVVLSPYSRLAGKTLHDLSFREKFGLNVLAIWREGTAIVENIRDLPLRFGDALLLFGPRKRQQLLAGESDFLVLSEKIQEPTRDNKSATAGIIMIGVILTAVLGWLPISISAVIGGTLMVLTGCLTMEEAYRYIEWKAIFLIAGMLPLGIAMNSSGAATLLAEGVVSSLGDYGVYALLAGFFILTTLASQVMPNPVVLVLMAPIALNTAFEMGISPYTMLMAIAISASASFISPVGHPANILIMGPGGYRFKDYVKVGLPLTILVLIVSLILLPVVFPLAQ